MEEPETNRSRSIVWLKRIGIVGFIFFLAKGILWLSVPSLIAWWALQ